MNRWRACILTSPQKPDVWDEVEADSLDELLEKLKSRGEEPFRVIIYRRLS